MPFGPLDLSFPKQQDEIKQDDKDKDTDTDMEQNPAEETAATQMESLTIDTNNNNINNIAYTTSDIDNAYFQALRQALYKHNQNITHMDLPMGSSQFMSGFILPNIPIPAPIPPIKKSSYKKASKFLKVMEKSHSGLVKVKEKGMTSLCWQWLQVVTRIWKISNRSDFQITTRMLAQSSSVHRRMGDGIPDFTVCIKSGRRFRRE